MTSPRDTPNPATSTRPAQSSKRVARKKPLAWLPLALLALLLLLVLLVVLLLALADDNDDDASSSAVPMSTTQAPGPSADSGTSSSVAPSSAGSSAGSRAGSSAGAATAASSPLAAGGQDLLALSGGSLAGQVGTPASGTAAVESVVSDEGFWVGSSKSSRVFVFLTDEARRSSGESGFQVTAGQRISLAGELVSVASSPSSASGVTDAEGRRQLAAQGALVRADMVALS